MKTSHFESGIALGAAQAADQRDEPTRREPVQHSIATLTAKGWSARKVARELGVDRETVSRYLRLETSKPAILPAGSQSLSEPNPAILPIGPKVGRTSQCLPLAEVIEQCLLAGLSAQRIYLCHPSANLSLSRLLNNPLKNYCGRRRSSLALNGPKNTGTDHSLNKSNAAALLFEQLGDERFVRKRSSRVTRKRGNRNVFGFVRVFGHYGIFQDSTGWLKVLLPDFSRLAATLSPR